MKKYNLSYHNIHLLFDNPYFNDKEMKLFQRFLMEHDCYLPYLMRLDCPDCWTNELTMLNLSAIIYNAFPWYNIGDPNTPLIPRGINKFLPKEWSEIDQDWRDYLRKHTKI